MFAPSPDELSPTIRTRTPSWTSQKLDLMLNDLRDNIRRLSTTVTPLELVSEPPSPSSSSSPAVPVVVIASEEEAKAAASAYKNHNDSMRERKKADWMPSGSAPMPGQDDEEAKEAETLRLILEANHHHAQYVALMDQALPIIEKLKAAKDGGFFTSLWAIMKGASQKTDRVKHLMERAEWEADNMRRKWDRAEQLALGLRWGGRKYVDMLREARQKAARQNGRIDARMGDIRRRMD